MSNQKSSNRVARVWVGLALISAALIMSACSSGGTAAQPGQAVVSQPQPQTVSSNNPPKVATAYRPGGQATPQPPIVIPPAPALPPSSGTILLADNFANTPISNYTIVDIGAGPDAPPSSWQVQNGMLAQNGDSDGNPAFYDTYALTGDAAWTNYSVEGEAYSGGSPFGLVARYSKAGFYRLRVNRSTVTGAGWLLQRYDSGKQAYTTLASGALNSGYTVQQWNHLKLTAQGSTISVTINGQPTASVSDATYAGGSVGFYAEASGARFSNLRVSALQ